MDVDFTGFENSNAFLSSQEIKQYNWNDNFSDGIAKLIVSKNADSLVKQSQKDIINCLTNKLIDFDKNNYSSLYQIHKSLFLLLNRHVATAPS